VQKSKSLFVVAVVATLNVTGCSKKDEAKKDEPAAAAPTAAAAQGCGGDYADPAKEFCVQLPAGYTAGTPDPPNSLYAELIGFNGPNSGFNITVGFTSSNWKTYDDQLKADQEFTSMSSIKVTSTGKTAGTGQWWVYTRADSTNSEVLSSVKSNGDKALRCTANNTVVTPEVVAACKSLRAYPK